MISLNQKKYVNSLKQKKFRIENKCFIVEGVKMVGELLKSDYELDVIYATLDWMENNPTVDCDEVSEKEFMLKCISD